MATSFPSYRKNIPEKVTEQIEKCLSYLPKNTGPVNFDSIMTVIMAANGVANATKFVTFAIGDTDNFQEAELKAKRKELKECALALIEEYGIQYVALEDDNFFLYDDFGLVGRIDIRPDTVTSTIRAMLPTSLSVSFREDMKQRFVEQELHLVEEITVRNKNLIREPKGLLIEDYSYLNPFFPFIDKGVMEWWDGFSQSSSDVSLLVGPAGTGKSTFIKACIDARGKAKNDVVIVSSEKAMKHPDIVGQIKDMPDNSLLILEDADSILGKRTEGNETMSELLNTISGVLSSKVKIIITTNRPSIGSIDEAILRPGRTYDIVQFQHLTSDQANAARQAIGRQQLDFDGKDQLTLAQALNWGDGNASKVVANRGPGF